MFRNYFKLKESFNFKPKTSSAFYPPQIATLYNFPNYNGSGQKVGIIELGGGYHLSDITTYLESLGITTTPDITDILIDSATNNPSDINSSYEVNLDLQIIISIVPSVSVKMYFAPNTYQGFYNAINQAITDSCNVISISWGAPESSWSSNQLNLFNSLFQTASNNSISVFCACGDNGSSDGISGVNVDFPSSSPYVVACGGTTLIASDNIITSETVWNDNSLSSATGGGISSFFSKPSYQGNISLMNQYSKRGVPDVSSCSDPTTGYLIYMNGQTVQLGGTSSSSPLWSALTAIMNQKNASSLGFLQPKLYSSTAGTLRDITVGNNGAFTAQVGYDLCTGLGSPCSELFTYLSTNITTFTPITSFTSNVTSGVIPLSVQFIDTSINSPTSWSWNFGDGGTSTSRNPVYIFRTAGTFTVTLTATNTAGSNTYQQTINTQSRVALRPVSLFNGLSVNFRDSSTNSPTSWIWNFGDGTSSTLQNPTHVFSRAGTYTIKLTVRNTAGTSVSQQNLTLR